MSAGNIVVFAASLLRLRHSLRILEKSQDTEHTGFPFVATVVAIGGKFEMCHMRDDDVICD